MSLQEVCRRHHAGEQTLTETLKWMTDAGSVQLWNDGKGMGWNCVWKTSPNDTFRCSNKEIDLAVQSVLTACFIEAMKTVQGME